MQLMRKTLDRHREQWSVVVRLWVDADASPGEMKDVVFRAGKRLAFETVLVANQTIAVPVAYQKVRSVCVPGGPDAADQHIALHAQPGDVAVTADIALAAVLVAKSVVTIDPRGEEYTVNDVRARLSVRNFNESLRGAGVNTHGPKPYGPKEKKAFAATLDRVLTKALRGR
jgi:uncharacterized protein YaiI (UPF0178 family)